MTSETVPAFFLYGEAPRAADPDFVHLEELSERSAPGGWHIAAHSHADLSHLILIAEGGGTVLFEGDAEDFQAPVLLVVPRDTIHSFTWQDDSQGRVLTLSEVQLQHLLARHAEFAALFEEPRVIALQAEEAADIATRLAGIARELSWISLGQNVALQALLLLVLVSALRSLQRARELPLAARPQDRLVARYRQLVEQRYRLREPVGTYARLLGTSETALRQACAARGQSPAQMRDQRALVEAQRLLAFSVLSVSQVGEGIGFDDPAYFSRFFTRKCGMSPARWRERSRVRAVA